MEKRAPGTSRGGNGEGWGGVCGYCFRSSLSLFSSQVQTLKVLKAKDLLFLLRKTSQFYQVLC